METEAELRRGCFFLKIENARMTAVLNEITKLTQEQLESEYWDACDDILPLLNKIQVLTKVK
jgi:aspartyl/asparaginyl beta-hydroxylase (cupin superfamily)